MRDLIRKRKAPVTLGALLLSAASLLAAGIQVSAQAPRPLEETAEADAPPQGRRAETARLFLVHRMRERLQMSDAQTLKVLDILKAMDEERAVHHRANRESLDRLRGLLDQQAQPEQALREQVTAFQREQVRFEGRLREIEQKLLDTLTPRQQAQFLLLRRELMQRLRGDGDPPPQRPRGRRRAQ